jgi:hypothetical protein
MTSILRAIPAAEPVSKNPQNGDNAAMIKGLGQPIEASDF